MKNLIYILSLALSSQMALANNCTTIELDKNSGSMSSIKVLDQGQTATCYAHAGTVMLNAYMRSTRGQKNFWANPYLAALLTNSDITSGGLSNFSCDAIESLAKYGNCDLENLNNNMTLSQLLQKISSLYIAPNNSTNDFSSSNLNPQIEKNAQQLMCYIKSATPEVIAEKELYNFISILNTNNKRFYIEEVVKLFCSKNLKKIDNAPKCVGDRRIRHGGEAKSNEYRDKLHELLERPNAQPVGIGYCAYVLMNGKDYVGYKPGFLGFTSVSDLANCGLHESVVIGRKKVGDKCFFKIRNSWGKYFYSHKDWINEDDGNVWVEENALTNNMGSISYLE